MTTAPRRPDADLGAPDPWARLASLTPARIGLGRVGPSLPTRQVLQLALAHAQARDAVHTVLDAGRIDSGLRALGLAVATVASAAPSRETYLLRPDLGGCLAADSRGSLAASAGAPVDLALVVADGLSAAAVDAHAVPLIAALQPHLGSLKLAPVVIATQARVALADDIGELLQARAAVILIGERPGLSAPDSLGAYLTFGPRRGRTNAERNCVSNIRAGGLDYDEAARKLAWLLNEALCCGFSGVALKDDSGRRVIDHRP